LSHLLVAAVLAIAPTHGHRSGCPQLYSVSQGERPAVHIYRGTRRVTLQNLRTMGRMEMCQRYKKRDQPIVRVFDRRLASAHAARVEAADTPWQGPAVASWYYDAGTTGCGFHATYGIATFVTGCGGIVRLRNPSTGAVVIATRDDSGPYVAGRTFDLDPATKAALGCSDLCDVQYALGG
jgi:hypothetical protein